MGTTETELPTFLTVEDTAKALRVSVPTVYRRIREGTIPAVRIGKLGATAGPTLRIPLGELRRALGLEELPSDG